MLYMLGQAIIDIRQDSSIKYLIKVGLSRKLNARINTYASDNPSAIYIANTSGTEREEKRCHTLLGEKGKVYHGEWYEVDQDFFTKCLRDGFLVFPNYHKKQTMMC